MIQVLIGCLIPIVLLIYIMTPITVRAEYRRNQGYWPQAKWVAWLQLIGLESAFIGILGASVAILVITVGKLPPVAYLDPRWNVATGAFEGIVGLAGLSFFGWAGLFIVQARRYGLPPRHPPT